MERSFAFTACCRSPTRIAYMPDRASLLHELLYSPIELRDVEQSQVGGIGVKFRWEDFHWLTLTSIVACCSVGCRG
jgi:hypothetical protein